MALASHRRYCGSGVRRAIMRSRIAPETSAWLELGREETDATGNCDTTIALAHVRTSSLVENRSLWHFQRDTLAPLHPTTTRGAIVLLMLLFRCYYLARPACAFRARSMFCFPCFVSIVRFVFPPFFWDTVYWFGFCIMVTLRPIISASTGSIFNKFSANSSTLRILLPFSVFRLLNGRCYGNQQFHPFYWFSPQETIRTVVIKEANFRVVARKVGWYSNNPLSSRKFNVRLITCTHIWLPTLKMWWRSVEYRGRRLLWRAGRATRYALPRFPVIDCCFLSTWMLLPTLLVPY